ncbi:MAG: hypothetical protein ACFFE2_13480 [Candidatus Thorarchaeota archaeon]
MGLPKKIGITILLYVILGFVWSVLMFYSIIPPPGGLSGPLNILYIIFSPITTVFFLILVSAGVIAP